MQRNPREANINVCGIQPTTWLQIPLTQHPLSTHHLTNYSPAHPPSLVTQTCSALRTSTLQGQSQAMAFYLWRLSCSSSHYISLCPQQTSVSLLKSLYTLPSSAHSLELMGHRFSHSLADQSSHFLPFFYLQGLEDSGRIHSILWTEVPSNSWSQHN